MNTLRDAARQALEALEWLERGVWCANIEGVTETLRAALTEPAPEPVYWEVCSSASYGRWLRVNQQQFEEYTAHGWEGRRLYTTPPQRQPQPEPQCECRACIREHDLREHGLPLNMTKMILCPTCGNKRCPHASDHRLACTNSNEPGQPGSVYGIGGDK